ncbi:hypothetical protein EDD16DRAFT_1671222 [Pisolithus croceorrhizus]|nr:hypothetical protein EDD16DRAFT_1671222 [Pisolithus croceorrhizus]KAI6108479.1 hypothetical protein EV401DRAFT_2000742 [Pisolithus croceorrhizus]
MTSSTISGRECRRLLPIPLWIFSTHCAGQLGSSRSWNDPLSIKVPLVRRLNVGATRSPDSDVSKCVAAATSIHIEPSSIREHGVRGKETVCNSLNCSRVSMVNEQHCLDAATARARLSEKELTHERLEVYKTETMKSRFMPEVNGIDGAGIFEGGGGCQE